MFEVADLDPQPVPPKLPGSVVVRATTDDAIDAAAADLFAHAINCVRAFGDFHLAVAVSGVERLLLRLMYDPATRELPWKRTHLWMVEEWRVSDDDPRRQFPHLRELLVDPSDIPTDQVHTINTGATDADAVYEAELREHLGWREKGHDRLDCVVLDGSIAPPEAPPVPAPSFAQPRLVRTWPAGAHRLPADLVAMTAQLLRGARFIGVLGVGEPARSLVDSLQTVLPARTAAQPTDPPTAVTPARSDSARDFPRSGLLPFAGELRWYLDRDACAARGASRA